MIKLKYEYVRPFHEGLAMVTKGNEKYGFIDKTGKEVIKQKYEPFGSTPDGFADGVVIIMKNGRWIIVDKKGKEIKLKEEYFFCYDFSDGLAVVNTTSGSVVINKKGKEVVTGYDSVSNYSEGILVAQKKGKYYFLDKKGNVVLK